MRILGIDPGLRLTGYGCIDTGGDQPSLVEAGVFRLGGPAPIEQDLLMDIKPRRAVTDVKTVSARLTELDRDLRELLGRLNPQLVAVEALFSHYKHPATAIVMGHARGVLLLAIRHAGIELREYKPNAVKKAVAGYGHADKSQVQAAVQARFSLPEPPSPPDVADALAIALCAAGRLHVERLVGEPSPGSGPLQRPIP